MPIVMHTSPRAELSCWLGRLVSLFRHRRQYGDLLHIEVAQDILADVSAVEVQAAREAYTAKENDHLAAALLREVLADGKVTPDEIPQLKQATRHIERAERADDSITELLPTT